MMTVNGEKKKKSPTLAMYLPYKTEKQPFQINESMLCIQYEAWFIGTKPRIMNGEVNT